MLVLLGCLVPLLLASAALGSPLVGVGKRDPFDLPVCSPFLPASCHNTTVETDLCCFESPGGEILQTQFWDTNPPTGPSNSWTIHGLWPDHCDGSYSEYCDPSREYTNITDILTNADAYLTLAYMQAYWKNLPTDGTDEELWAHEWAAHGTCYSTLSPSCIKSSVYAQEAVYFYTRVVELFQTRPTYDFLAWHGIFPSNTTTYTQASLLSALKASSGFTPAILCSGSNLSQIYWYFNLQGSLVDGIFLPYDARAGSSDCPTDGIKYLPKVE